MKKYLFIALAALGFAACEKPAEDNNAQQNGELEQSYVAITLAADDMGTRADNPVYDEGLATERTVASAHVFFFDESGEPFIVTWNNPNRNWIMLDTTELGMGDTAQVDGSVSDISKQVLIINNYKGEYPAKVLAILNWTPNADTYRLSDLQTAIVALQNSNNHFVMSNAVYDNENANTDAAVVDAVPLTAKNIGKMKPGVTPSANEVEPVVIYVERIAAKVRYTAEGDTTTGIEGLYDIGVEEVGGNKIYAQVVGFELFNDHQESYLIKHIDPNWTNTADNIGFSWNNPAWFRSYWATSIDKAFPENAFAWNHADIDFGATENYTYLGENTAKVAGFNHENTANYTKVIVKANLGKVLENGTFEAVEIANWFGNNYVGEENLLKEVANMLKNEYFFSTDGATFTGITPEDLMCVQRGGNEHAYEVFFRLSDKVNVGKAKTWYKYANGTYEPHAVDKFNEELAMVQPALVYNDGMTYYWLDIKHLGAPESVGEYGIVRNHVYDVKINSITGFGTPIYDPNQDFVVPEKPEDVASYVYAQINILSWRVVSHNYDI